MSARRRTPNPLEKSFPERVAIISARRIGIASSWQYFATAQPIHGIRPDVSGRRDPLTYRDDCKATRLMIAWHVSVGFESTRARDLWVFACSDGPGSRHALRS